MKKMVSTLTAVAFALGLASAGLAQTAASKDVEKPAVTMETPASQPQAAPVDKEKAGVEKATKLETKKAKKTKEAKEKTKKSVKTEKGKTADKPEQPAAPVEQAKPETK